MNRKLNHAMLALSTTATVFTLLLLVGSPLPASTQVASLPLPTGVAPLVEAVDGAAVDPVARRHIRHSRALIALPYFSFAQGLRRSRS
jgi:hypothetical protein